MNIYMQGAIFDVDGTLLDSMSVWWDVLIEFYKQHGVELSDTEAMTFKEVTLDESIPMMIDRFSLSETPDEVLNILKGMTAKHYETTLPLKEGAKEYLKRLHGSGVKIAIATSGYEELCKTAFMRLGVWQYIDACAFSSEVGVNKSNPDVYLLAAKRIGVQPEECIVYEDILAGINGAKKGGFRTCAVYDDTNADETDTLKELADCYITCWNDLLSS